LRRWAGASKRGSPAPALGGLLVTGSGQQCQPGCMGGPNHMEVASIECGDGGLAQTFRKGHERRVGPAQREVRVLLHEVCSPGKILIGGDLDPIAP
jgi:hypothetical protein